MQSSAPTMSSDEHHRQQQSMLCCRRTASDETPAPCPPARRLFARSSVASPPRDDMIDLTADSSTQQQEAKEAGDDTLQLAAVRAHGATTATAAAADVMQTDTLQTGCTASNSGIRSGAAVSSGSSVVDESPAVGLIGFSPTAGALTDGSAAVQTQLADNAGANKALAGVPPAAGGNAADDLIAARNDNVSRLVSATCDLLPDKAVPQTPPQRRRSEQQQAEAE
jgi:hypothetical protein